MKNTEWTKVSNREIIHTATGIKIMKTGRTWVGFTEPNPTNVVTTEDNRGFATKAEAIEATFDALALLQAI